MVNRSPYRALSRRAQFQALKDEGRVFHVNSWLLLNWRVSNGSGLSCGWTIPSYVGPAVVRNRLRRWGREYFRNWALRDLNRAGLELNVILKRKEKGFFPHLAHEEFDEALDKATSKISREIRK